MKETYESQKTPSYTPVYGSPSYRTQLYEIVRKSYEHCMETAGQTYGNHNNIAHIS